MSSNSYVGLSTLSYLSEFPQPLSFGAPKLPEFYLPDTQALLRVPLTPELSFSVSQSPDVMVTLIPELWRVPQPPKLPLKRLLDPKAPLRKPQHLFFVILLIPKVLVDDPSTLIFWGTPQIPELYHGI